MAVPLFKKLQQFNPCGEPDWRHRRVMELVNKPLSDGKPRRTSLYDDEIVRVYRKFMQSYRKGDQEGRLRFLMLHNPALFMAHYMFERSASGNQADADMALLIEARLLAGQTNQEIANLAGTHPDVIEWYSLLFFDVRPRLEHRDWIVTRVLVPALIRSPASGGYGSRAGVEDEEGDQPIDSVNVFGHSFLDGSCKYFAYYGGPAVLDAILGGERRLATPDTAISVLDDFFKRQMRIKAIQAIARMPINRYNVGLLQENYLRIIELEKSAGDTADENVFRSSMHQLLSNLQFSVGDRAKKLVSATPMKEYYGKDYVLRDHEMHQVMAGGKLQIADEPNPLLNRKSTIVKEERLPDAVTVTD